MTQPSLILIATGAMSGLATLIAIWVLIRLSHLRQELDDQGIKLIQLTNMTTEQKKDLAMLQTNVSHLLDQLERTNHRLTPLSNTPPPVAVSQPPRPAKNKPRPRDEDESEHVEAPTRVRHKDSMEGSVSSDEPTNERNVAPPELSSNAHRDVSGAIREFTSGDFDSSPIGKDLGVDIAEVPGSKGKEVRAHKEFSTAHEFTDLLGRHLTKVGFFLPCQQQLAVGTRVDLQLVLPDQSSLLCGKGEVKRWHQSGGERGALSGCDVRFIYIDQASKENIRRLLAD